MTDKLYKARLMRENGEDMDLAWNIHEVKFYEDTEVFVIYHAKGRVFHKLKAGDTIIMLEQYSGQDE